MLRLDPTAIDLAALRLIWAGAACRLDDPSLKRVEASAAAVERIVAGGETVYGINTGFGLLANTRIPADRLAELQRNLILSHSCGLGEPLPRRVVGLMIVLKLLGLGRGFPEFGRSLSTRSRRCSTATQCRRSRRRAASARAAIWHR